MISIFAKEFSRLDLGHRGENLARRVIFDLARWHEIYGEGVAMLAARLPETEIPYPCSVIREGDTLIWELSAADTSVAGKGQCELSYYVGERLVKSVVFSTYISESLAPVGEMPDPKESWFEDILAASANAIAAKEAVEGMSVSAHTVSSDSPAGVSKSEQDGHVHLSFSLPCGEVGAPGAVGPTGAPGKTPVRGEDYFTSEDMAFFENSIETSVYNRLGPLEDALDAILVIQQELIGGETA